jgi:hypothetical protein
MIVMKARSVVVEFIVTGPNINLCYLSMAVCMQHIYRAVVPVYASQFDTMFVEPSVAAATLKAALEYKFELDIKNIDVLQLNHGQTNSAVAANNVSVSESSHIPSISQNSASVTSGNTSVLLPHAHTPQMETTSVESTTLQISTLAGNKTEVDFLNLSRSANSTRINVQNISIG